MVRHRVVGLDDPFPYAGSTGRISGTSRSSCLRARGWSTSSRLVWGDHRESYVNDPLNPKLAHGPFGASSALRLRVTRCRSGARLDPEARPGELVEQVLKSKALRRDMPFGCTFRRGSGPWCVIRC